MEFDILQVIGYIASCIIALSMTMSSILKFRWINLAGASLFSTYGFLIGSIPVGVLNGFIMLVDLFYLRKIYFKNDLFDILEVRGDNKYLLKFLKFHDKEIQKFFPGFAYKAEMNTISFFVLRNMAVAGIFLAHEKGNNTLNIGLDYAVPEYRDFKNGKFIFKNITNKLLNKGITQILTSGFSTKHIKYLKNCGFKKNMENNYVKILG